MFIDIVHPKLTNAYNAKTLVPNLNYILFSLISEKMIEMINFQFRIYLAEFLNLYTFANFVSLMLTSRYTFIRNFTFIRTAILAIGFNCDAYCYTNTPCSPNLNHKERVLGESPGECILGSRNI